MKILVSAFACSPRWGSEPGCAWGWVWELATRHELVVLTHEHFRAHIDPVMEAPDAARRRIRFVYLGLAPTWGRPFGEQLLNSRLYYVRWQRASRRRILELLGQHRFDLVHHLTWGNFRWPVPLHALPVPVVIGPLGGGERAPATLYRGLPLRSRIKERIRDLLIGSGRIDPFVRRGLSGARWIFCRTPQTLAALPAPAQPRATIAHDVALSEVISEIAPSRAASTNALRMLFVGRLLAWKGPHFVLETLARLRRRGIPAKLTIVGSGELELFLANLAERLDVAGHVQWQRDLERAEVLALYERHDLFVFPSLHDSGGTVVLESLSRGCPVVCVDLGGPPHFVDNTCGRIVRASDGDPEAVVDRLTDVIAELAADPAASLALRRGALRMARRHLWSERVSQAYAPIVQALGGVTS